jgi:hypothetical protein
MPSQRVRCLTTSWFASSLQVGAQHGPARAGRVKTLHPGVHGGILARRDLPEHMAAIEKHGISPIDLVVVNLYPFRQTVTAASKPSYEVRSCAALRCASAA